MKLSLTAKVQVAALMSRYLLLGSQLYLDHIECVCNPRSISYIETRNLITDKFLHYHSTLQNMNMSYI